MILFSFETEDIYHYKRKVVTCVVHSDYDIEHSAYNNMQYQFFYSLKDGTYFEIKQNSLRIARAEDFLGSIRVVCKMRRL